MHVISGRQYPKILCLQGVCCAAIPGLFLTNMNCLIYAGVGAGSLEGARARDRGASSLRITAAQKKDEARQATAKSVSAAAEPAAR